MENNLLKKYIWLTDTIYRSCRITLKELNLKWMARSDSNGAPMARRTFIYNRNAIEELFGINIVCDSSSNEYYIENADDLNGNETLRWMLSCFTVGNVIQESKEISERIILEDVPSAQEYLTDILTAMRENYVIELTYHPFWSQEALILMLQPYFVKLFNRRWYVFGRTEQDTKIKVYAFDRVKKVVKTEKPFMLPADFSAMVYLFDSIGIIKTDEDKPCEILIKAFGDTAKYLRALPMHHSQKEKQTTDAYSVFSYWLVPTYDFYQEILSKREKVEVLAPERVREEIKGIIGDMLGYYL